MAKFLVDENLSPLVADHLRKQGFRAFAVRELGLCGKPDEAILDFARGKGLVILTGDIEFGKFFYERHGTVSTVILRSTVPGVAAVSKIVSALAKKKILETLPETGCLVLVNNRKVRIRKYFLK